MSALKEVLREYIEDGGSREVYTEAVAELEQLADDNKRLTDSILALRGEMVMVRQMWKETIGENAQLREYIAAYKDRLQHIETHYDAVLRDIVKLRAENAEMREALEEISPHADHQIPFYAYGNNEAGVDLAHRLDFIFRLARAVLAKYPEETK